MPPDAQPERNLHLLPHNAWLIFHGLDTYTPEIDAHIAGCEQCDKLMHACYWCQTFGEFLRYLNRSA